MKPMSQAYRRGLRSAGFFGEAKFSIPNDLYNEEFARITSKLLSFGEYSNVGRGRTSGLGMIRVFNEIDRIARQSFRFWAIPEVKRTFERSQNSRDIRADGNSLIVERNFEQRQPYEYVFLRSQCFRV